MKIALGTPVNVWSIQIAEKIHLNGHSYKSITVNKKAVNSVQTFAKAEHLM